MLGALGRFLTQNKGLKLAALVLSLALWFYVVNELNQGSDEDKQFLKRVLPSEGLTAKKLTIRPVFIGAPKYGFMVENARVVVVPEFCIVVGSKDLLGRIRFAYTMPIDLRGVSKTFSTSIALNPIAPGVYMEDTLVQVIIPVQRSTR